MVRRGIALLAVILLAAACAAGPQSEGNRQFASLDDQWATSDDEWATSDDQWAASDEDDFEESDGDPLELPNRFVFAANDAFDRVLFQPAAATYRFLLPTVVQDSVQNFMRNLRTPANFANHLFQGKTDGAEDVLIRFFVNSTIGIGGLLDVAADWGYPHRKEDFGQTLGYYGAGEGFYLVLPILGPSSARDGIGLLVDTLLDPLTYLLNTELAMARFAIEGIDTRSRNIELIDEIRRDSIDFYARMRSLYRQHRQDLINDGELDAEGPAPGISGEEFQSSDATGWN